MKMRGEEEGDAVPQEKEQNAVRLSALIAADAAGCPLPVQAAEKWWDHAVAEPVAGETKGSRGQSVRGVTMQRLTKQSTRTGIKQRENVLSMFIVFHSLHALQWAATWTWGSCLRVWHADSVGPPGSCLRLDLNSTVDNPLTTAVNRQRLLGNKSITTTRRWGDSESSSVHAPGALAAAISV